MAHKTHTTVAVIIPPTDLWNPIQVIRQKYDRNIRRWMPHITLLYPFRPKEHFQKLAEQFSTVLQDFHPIKIELKEFRFFEHRKESFTLWLAPEPKEGLIRLQSTLVSVVPDCDDVQRISGEFVPHLSVGQVKGRDALRRMLDHHQKGWEPISFMLDEVSLIWRNEPPDDVFRTGQNVGLRRV